MTRTLSRKKKVVFAAAAVLLGWVGVELICLGGVYYIEQGYPQTIRYYQEAMARTGTAGARPSETIHPYLGWVMNPQTSRGADFAGRHFPINSLGFNDEEHGVPKRGPDRLIVGVAGGSVAWQMSTGSEETLVRKLREHTAWRGKEIRIVRMAMSGYKQPQQLMGLNFLLALGAEFDVIVNIDGYNEMALPACENDKSKVFAAYPRAWHARMQNVVDPRVYSISFRLYQTRAWRQQMAVDRINSWLSWSPTLNLIWWLRDRGMENQLIELATELKHHKDTSGFGFPALGPKQLYDGQEAMYEHLTELWSNCSLQMHRLCRSNGIAYLHVLQPNQYFPGSKPLSAEELQDMIVKDQEYGQAIATGYPMLIRAGEELRKDGVDFHDLTRLFASTAETIYVDYFCHYNQQGNDMLAEAVADAMCRAFALTSGRRGAAD